MHAPHEAKSNNPSLYHLKSSTELGLNACRPVFPRSIGILPEIRTAIEASDDRPHFTSPYFSGSREESKKKSTPPAFLQRLPFTQIRQFLKGTARQRVCSGSEPESGATAIVKNCNARSIA